MINDDVLNSLNEFISFHMNYQIKAYELANKANDIGFPGFACWFQVEAADAVAHTRRIMNYINDRNSTYKVIINLEKVNLEKADIFVLVNELMKIKVKGVELANKLIQIAQQKSDYTTVKFYDWFLIDFFEEISDESDLLDRMKMNETSLYELDKKMAKAAEPDVLEVIKPFSPHAD